MAKIKHIALATQEPEASANFYRDVFELEIVGRVDTEDAEGYYLSDGDINLAILRFKTDRAAGEEFGTGYSGLHHIGFQVDDMTSVDSRLRKANSRPRDKINSAANSKMGKGNRGRNVELEYSGPDGVLIDVSQVGWVTGQD